jgi:hypothetical protein
MPAELEQHLAEAVRYLEVCKERVAEQEAKVAELERNGRPSDDQRRLLQDFKDTLRLAEERRKLIASAM